MEQLEKGGDMRRWPWWLNSIKVVKDDAVEMTREKQKDVRLILELMSKQGITLEELQDEWKLMLEEINTELMRLNSKRRY